jgi:hypothetical protein
MEEFGSSRPQWLVIIMACALWELIPMNHDLLVVNKSYLYESNPHRQLT